MTGDEVVLAELAVFRRNLFALFRAVAAARMEVAALRRIRRVRDLALEKDLFVVDARIGYRLG